MDSDGTCNLTEPTDLPNTDPLLGPLQDNGGPTETHALLPGSPAIDAGDDSIVGEPLLLTTDQRGQPRLQGAHVDIGAYETVPADGVPGLSEWGLIAIASLLAAALVWKLTHGTRREEAYSDSGGGQQ